MKRIATLVVGIALLLSVPSSALATSSCQSYNPQTCTSVVSTTTTQSPTTATEATGTLPFTGLDVALLLAGGAVLLGTGLVVRRVSRRIN